MPLHKSFYQPKKYLISTYVERIHDIQCPNLKNPPALKEVEASPTRCPHLETAIAMEARVLEMKKSGDSVGGSIICRVSNLPTGLGAPVFDRIEADYPKPCFPCPRLRPLKSGVDLKVLGSKDLSIMTFLKIVPVLCERKPITLEAYKGELPTGKNSFRVAFKPTATVLQIQKTVDQEGNETELMGRGRHDPCVLPRAVPIVEAMTALVLIDHQMVHAAQCDTYSEL